MKINRRLSAALVVLVTLFTGCQEELKTGIDTNCPAPEDFTYDLDFSAEKSIAVYWDASKAITAGARSFTVQLTPDDNFNRGDNYNATISKTLQITDDIYDSVTFTNLGSDDIYYVRVRANYPYSKYSEWVYLSYNAKPAPYAVGYGPVDSAAVNIANIAYDAATSTTDKMVFTFDSAEGASLVRLQLINYTTLAVTKTVTVAADATSVEFAALGEGDQYSVRARSEFEENGYVRVASWKEFTAEATKDDGTVVETNVFEVGKGPVVPKDVPPVGQLVEATSSTLAFSWSESGFASVAKDIKRPYRIEIFKDADCQELVVGWDISANNAIYKSKTPTFLFSGLDQNTTYYFRATDTESGLASEVVSGTTEAFTVTTISETKADAGDVVLAEDFSELIWGGDYLNGFAGYSAKDRNLATAFDKAQGLNGKDGKTWGWYLVDNSTEIGLFNTMKLAVASSRLAKWGIIAETTPAGHICARPGMLKLGASSYAAQIVTPELSSLKETATIEVSFKAALYGSDNTSGGVYVVNTTDNNDCLIEKYEEQLAEQYPLEKTWKKETFTLSNISPSSRIAIGNVRTPGTTPGSNQQRMFVDEIVIKVVSYGSVAIQLDKPVVEIVNVADASIDVQWTAVDKATGYVVEYKKEADAEWTAMEPTTATTATISGLTPETAYEVRVYATAAGDSKSEASDVVKATTVEAPKFPVSIATADEWMAFINGEDIALGKETDVVTITADLDFTGKEYATTAVFKGIIEGSNKTIKNLNATTPFLKGAGSVKDLTFDASCALTATVDGKYAMLAEVSTGLISNVTNHGAVTVDITAAPKNTDALIAAGLVAEANGDMVNCNNTADITVTSSVGLEASLAGGICGYGAGKISNCNNSGKVSQSTTHFILSASCTYKDIAVVPQHTGGIVAMTQLGSLVENCTNTGRVILNMTSIEKNGKSAGTNRVRTGGIVGAARGHISGCTNKGNIECYAVTSDRQALTKHKDINYSISPGGITGGAHDYGSAKDGIMNVTNCVNEGNIIVDADVNKNNSTVGGIVGHPGWEDAGNPNTIENCINRGNITVTGSSKFRLGGINGGMAKVKNCENHGTLNVTNGIAGSTVAGISGYMGRDHEFENNKNLGNINVTGSVALSVAGLIGGVTNNDATYGQGCVVKCAITVSEASLPTAGMVFTTHTNTTTVNFGTTESPIKVSGSFNGTEINANNVATTAQAAGSKAVMNVVYSE